MKRDWLILKLAIATFDTVVRLARCRTGLPLDSSACGYSWFGPFAALLAVAVLSACCLVRCSATAWPCGTW